MGSAAGTDVGQIPQLESAGACPCGNFRSPSDQHSQRISHFSDREIMMKALQVLAAAAAMAMSIAPTSAAEDVVIVYDASGSMWGQIDGVSKIELAREVMADLVTGWSDGTNLGLVAYGHRSEGDCGDIETLIEPGRSTAQASSIWSTPSDPGARRPSRPQSSTRPSSSPIATIPQPWC